MPQQPVWKRLVRLVANEDGKEYYGEPQLGLEADVGELFSQNPSTLKVRVLDPATDPLSSSAAFVKPDKIVTPRKLLAPVDVERYGASIRCLGTNYPIGGAKKPPLPILFFKPYTCLAGYGDPIVVPKAVQDQSDYEVELVIVIGKEGRDIPASKALEHVIGYTLCNDVSARKRMFATPQWGMGKCYDGWLPLGPCLVATSSLPASAQAIALQTSITPSSLLASAHSNPVQDGNTKDMLWQIAETVSALSYGTTLKKGDIVCTGTPDGQGSNRKPQLWLKDGMTVKVSAPGIGSLSNPVVWEKDDKIKAKL